MSPRSMSAPANMWPNMEPLECPRDHDTGYWRHAQLYPPVRPTSQMDTRVRFGTKKDKLVLPLPHVSLVQHVQKGLSLSRGQVHVYTHEKLMGNGWMLALSWCFQPINKSGFHLCSHAVLHAQSRGRACLP